LFSRKFKLKRRSSVMAGVFAGLAFLALAVFGWDVPAQRVASYFVITLLFLALIVIGAALIALIMVLSRKLKKE